ncbi:hypothetical protein ISN41_09270 [Enterobacter bugandensis]|uniref:hypothetical protein n=1 Tax=Enterobacter bugandensis TaxID=881260 RepID=UPI00188904F8|nr:hypothetical protein [Enterobacter bugandensis]MBF2748283.1 hypothetical protein [Enterobacter bugandensis]MBF2800177.1 hypothetical protein [Enterobacter bugandensis]
MSEFITTNINYVSGIIKEHPFITSSTLGMAGVVIGAVGNHKLSLARDRIKEFNIAADKVMISLREQRSELSSNQWPERFISDKEIYPLIVNHGFILRRRTGKAWERYQQARKNCQPEKDEYGDVISFNASPMIKAIEDLMKFARHK